jgi:hypothetical protein
LLDAGNDQSSSAEANDEGPNTRSQGIGKDQSDISGY